MNEAMRRAEIMFDEKKFKLQIVKDGKPFVLCTLHSFHIDTSNYFYWNVLKESMLCDTVSNVWVMPYA